MKNMLLKTLSVCCCASALLLGGTACKKIDDALKPTMPEATQEGKGTFGCLVGGQLWLPYNPDAGSLFPNEYAVRTNSFRVGAPVLTVDVNNRRENAGLDHLTLSVRPASAVVPGVYTLGNGFSATATLGAEGYDTANAGSGTLTISKVEAVTQTVNGITTRSTVVSGTFQFVAGSTGGKTVAVTDGRFDLAPLY